MSMAQPQPMMSNGVEIDADAGEVYGVRKLRESGDSLVISIPPEVLQTSDLEAGEMVEVATNLDGGEIRVRHQSTAE